MGISGDVERVEKADPVFIIASARGVLFFYVFAGVVGFILNVSANCFLQKNQRFQSQYSINEYLSAQRSKIELEQMPAVCTRLIIKSVCGLAD